MSEKNYTHIISIIDRSGSMRSIQDDMEQGFDSFIEEQKKVDGKATLTLAQFDNEYEMIHNNIPINEASSFSLNPRGGTALLDAIGKTLSTERERINAMVEDEQPEKVICIIITDGQENVSQEYDRQRIFDMISDMEKQKEPQWDFVFLGANQDAIAEGSTLGIRQEASLTYGADSIGTQNMFCSLSANTSAYRTSEVGDAYSFSNEDRENQEKTKRAKQKQIEEQKRLMQAKFNQSIPDYMSDLNLDKK